jgi:hypothetical protein
MITFRVCPARRGRLFFDVRIYPDEQRMRRALRRQDRWLGTRRDWSRSEAVCTSFETQIQLRGRWTRTPRLGVLFFHRRSLGAGLVAHEMTHAAVVWARRVGVSGRRVWHQRGDWEGGANERFADAVGNLCAHFWVAFYRARRHWASAEGEKGPVGARKRSAAVLQARRGTR